MKKLVSKIVLALMLTLSLTPLAQAADKDWSVDFDLTYNSKYVWRGLTATDGSVLQPSFSLAYKGFSAGVWGNVDLSDVNGEQGNFTEVDLWAEYAHSFGMFTPAVGVIYYHFPPDDSANTTEIYLSLGFDVILSPTLVIYYDVDQIQGLYISLGISHSFDLYQKGEMSVALDLGATAGWGSEDYNAGYWGVNKSGFNDVLLSVGLPITVMESLTITPMINYSAVVDTELRDAVENDSNFYAGISITFSL